MCEQVIEALHGPDVIKSHCPLTKYKGSSKIKPQIFKNYVYCGEMHVDMEIREDIKWQNNMHKIGLSFMHLTT